MTRKTVNRNIEWNVEGTLQCLTLSDNKENLPDIFIIKLLPGYPAIGKFEN